MGDPFLTPFLFYQLAEGEFEIIHKFGSVELR